MKTFQFLVGENVYKFECEFVEKRNGFGHVARMHKNNMHIKTAKAHYLNRTWENYTYQSVMKQAVYEMIDQTKSGLDFTHKNETGKKRMPKGMREELYNACPIIAEYKELLTKI